MWLNQNFLLAEEVDYKMGFSISFVSLRNHQEMHVQVDGSGEITVRTYDIDLAGDIVQSICQYLHLEDLEVNFNY
jgi:Bardet-Biedl syndrome 2 protein